MVSVHAGNILTLDSGDKSTLTGASKAEINSGVARITVEQDGTVGIFGTTINIGASENVSIHANNEVIMSATNISIEAADSVAVDAGSEAKVTAPKINLN